MAYTGTITRRAEKALHEGSYNPNQFFRVLNTEDYFKQFKKELLDRVTRVENPFVVVDGYGKRIPIPAVNDVEEEEEPLYLTEDGEKALVDWLLDRLKRIDPDNKWARPSKGTIEGWIKGNSDGKYTRPKYGERDPKKDNAIKICFALGLDDIESEQFLSKGGISQRAFNPRDAHQTVYRLCLMANSYESNLERYSNAMEAIERFDKYRAENPPEPSENDDSTQSLLNKLDGSDSHAVLSTPDAIVDFLIENRKEYERESQTVWKNYLRVRAELCMIIVERQLRWSQEEIILKKALGWLKETEGLLATCRATEEDGVQEIVDTEERRVKSLVQKMSSIDSSEHKHDDASLWCEVADEWRAIADDLLDIFEALRFRSLLSSQMIYDRTLAAGRPRINENAIKVELSSLPEDGPDLRIRSFFDYFPTDQTLDAVDVGPGAKGFSIDLARKAIVSFYFFNYAYRWIEAEDDVKFKTFGHEKFRSKLNGLLARCQLSLLYAADPCDMLIMKSIMAYDPTCNDSGSLRSPIEFFNWVVAASFSQEENA